MSEGAVIVAAAKARLSILPAIGTNPSKEYPMVSGLEVPFNSTRKMAITVHQLAQEDYFDKLILGSEGRTGSSFTHVALLKGAPDRILQVIDQRQAQCIDIIYYGIPISSL